MGGWDRGDDGGAQFFQGKERNTTGERAKGTIPMAVGLYITAGYWFTSSTSFANPAVTVARSFTNTFASINPNSFGHYFGGQAIGLALGMPFLEWMYARKPLSQACAILVRG